MYPVIIFNINIVTFTPIILRIFLYAHTLKQETKNIYATIKDNIIGIVPKSPAGTDPRIHIPRIFTTIIPPIHEKTSFIIFSILYSYSSR